MRNKNLKKIVLAALFLAIALILPVFTGQIRKIGNMLLPMHLPVMLCGLICGPYYGLSVGFAAPILRSILFGMPKLYPNAAGMCFELAAYGFVIGFLYSRSKNKSTKELYKCIILSMLSGRVVWGIVRTIMMCLGDTAFGYTLFISNALLSAIPGIILQLIAIPLIMKAIKET